MPRRADSRQSKRLTSDRTTKQASLIERLVCRSRTDAPFLDSQVPFAEALKSIASIPISAVGLITSGKQAEEILQNGQADIITVARHFSRDPSLVLNWAQELDTVVNVPVQYQRAYTRMMTKKE